MRRNKYHINGEIPQGNGAYVIH